MYDAILVISGPIMGQKWCAKLNISILIYAEGLILPTEQIYVRGIFVEQSHDIFPEYLEKVPYEIPGNIPKIMFREY